MKIQVLDHGYVEFIEAWGHGKACLPQMKHFDEGLGEAMYDMETGIVEAARQSTQGSFRGWDEDAQLLARLYKNNHASPFEFAGMIIEVQAPILVFREWQRHRTQSYNEASARYAPLPDLYYNIGVDELIERAHRTYASRNKQEKGIAPPDDAAIADWLAHDREVEGILEAHYRAGLAAGVPKEVARKRMPVDHYSKMRAGAFLRNWLGFLRLRMDPGAQWEIRQFAIAVDKIVGHVFPRAWELFRKRDCGRLRTANR